MQVHNSMFEAKLVCQDSNGRFLSPGQGAQVLAGFYGLQLISKPAWNALYRAIQYNRNNTQPENAWAAEYALDAVALQYRCC